MVFKARKEEMATQCETKVYLIIAGLTCKPHDITNIIGLEPTRTWLRGDIAAPRTIVKRKENAWVLDANPAACSSDLDGSVQSLLSVVSAYTDGFASLPAGVETTLQCVVYDYDRSAVLGLSSETIRMLATIRADVDIDYYDLSRVDDTQDSDTP